MAKKTSRKSGGKAAAKGASSPARKKASLKRSSRRSLATAAGTLSMGPIHLAMQRFIDAVDSSNRTEPHVLEARARIAGFLDNMPLCLAADDPKCDVPNPPKACRFAPVKPQ